ncbi:MAG: aquaporin, partial [Terriglobia bacterium]
MIAGKNVGFLGIAFAFGFALIAMAYGIGPISGCHINPAVSLGVYTDGRMDGKNLVGYIAGQILGALAAAGVLATIASGLLTGYSITGSGLRQNGWGEGYLGGYGLTAAIVFEFVATLLFLIVILGSTQTGAPSQMAGLAIGITLVVIHILRINITGVS